MTYTTPDLRSRIRGCLLGGAIGDAMGAPVEFHSLTEILDVTNNVGVREYSPAAHGVSNQTGHVTDDTQMTLFTVEGIIRAIRREERGLGFTTAVLHHAYLRWLMTQDSNFRLKQPDGWLLNEQWMWSKRAPGLTCLSSLKEWDGASFGAHALNESKGCGTVMRSAPIGFLITRFNEAHVFEIACEAASYTHGHPTGQIAAGALALIIAHIVDGRSLPDAVEVALQFIADVPRSHETVNSLRAAVALAARPPSAVAVESLGGGWIAEEALAVAVYCALQFPEAHQTLAALSLAVTHSGDSDSTGSICGNLLGTLHGVDALPADLLASLEGRATLDRLAGDFAAVLVDTHGSREQEFLDRYPAW